MNNLKLLIFQFLKLTLGKYYYPFLLRLVHYKKNYFVGHSLKSNIIYIDKIIEDYNCKSLLDFGCGKPILYNPNPYKRDLDIFLYDPFYSSYKKVPSKKYDMVVCTDVMEHIEKNNIENILKQIQIYTNKVIYFAICTRPAHKNLPDGRNAHITLLNDKEWIGVLRKQINNNIKIYIRFDENSNIITI